MECVNDLFCSLVSGYVKRRDNNYKFVLSTVDGILDKKALLSEVKNDLSCQWSWKVEDKITLSITRPSLSVSEVCFCNQCNHLASPCVCLPCLKFVVLKHMYCYRLVSMVILLDSLNHIRTVLNFCS